jgi:hypothetical protein
MLYLLNGTMRPGVNREQFIEYLKQPMDPAEWDLIKNGVVSHLLFKTGEVPGLLIIIHAESLEAAMACADKTPIVQAGLLDFVIDPVNRFPHFE